MEEQKSDIELTKDSPYLTFVIQNVMEMWFWLNSNSNIKWVSERLSLTNLLFKYQEHCIVLLITQKFVGI